MRLKKALERFGYIGSYPKGGSSHCTFRKDGEDPITIPNHGHIKVVYVEIVKKAIERESGK